MMFNTYIVTTTDNKLLNIIIYVSLILHKKKLKTQEREPLICSVKNLSFYYFAV